MIFDDAYLRHVFTVLHTDGWDDGSTRLLRECNTLENALLRDTHRLTVVWIAIERGHFGQAERLLEDLQSSPQISIWLHACQILLTLRTGRLRESEELLDRVDIESSVTDTTAKTILNHLRCLLFYQLKRIDEALQIIVAEVESVSPESFLSARLFDSLGMLFAADNRFFAAREFYEKSLRLKEHFGDHAGQALTHGNLGRLYFDSGMLSQSLDHFNRDLELADCASDVLGVAVAHNWLGRIELEVSNWEEARVHLQSAIRLAEQIGSQRLKAFALKDIALATCNCGDADQAQAELKQARSHFAALDVLPGHALCDAVEGVIQRALEHYGESASLLDAAAKQFVDLGFWIDGAKVRRERSRTLTQSGALPDEIVIDLLSAVELAEKARSDYLLRQIEEELKEVDSLKHMQLVYRRVRGRNVDEDTISLVSGKREMTSVLFLDLAGSTEYGRAVDSEVVMLEFNQMMSGFNNVLQRYDAVISGYRGDGCMCMFRHDEHAYRSVAAALELIDLIKDFNLPRRLLGKEPYTIRIGISTGEVFNGNVGTYAKMDFTSIGSAANLAARLQAEAQPGRPCICSETQRQVRDRFEFANDGPREIKPKGFGDVALCVWEVVRFKAKEPKR